LNEKWVELKKIRDICNISIEEKRASKVIGSSLEANLLISINNEQSNFIEDIDLAELCITSEANIIITNDKEIKVETQKAVGEKCPVCWKISKEGCQRHTN
jgi:isoleucyl-tRNA synthetase